MPLFVKKRIYMLFLIYVLFLLAFVVFKFILSLLLLLLLSACVGENSDPDGLFTSDRECPTNMECFSFSAPKDYSDPFGEQVEIFYGRHQATDVANRIGVLFFNYGGPGAEAVDATAIMVNSFLPDEILEKFDIVAIDPRGTGKSAFSDELLACASANNCQSVYSSIAPYMTTNVIAQDMDRLREILGESEINYLGYSYGGRLGNVYIDMFPDNIRAVVLDSPSKGGNVNYDYDLSTRALQYERLFESNEQYSDQASNRTFLENIVSDFEDGTIVEYTSSGDSVTINEDEFLSILSYSIRSIEDSYWNDIFEDFYMNDILHAAKQYVSGGSNILINDEDKRFFEALKIVNCLDRNYDIDFNSTDVKDDFYAAKIYGHMYYELYFPLCEDLVYLNDPVSNLNDLSSKIDGKKVMIIGIDLDTNTPYSYATELKTLYGSDTEFVTVNNKVQHGMSFVLGTSNSFDQMVVEHFLDPTADTTDKSINYNSISVSPSFVIPAYASPVKKNTHPLKNPFMM